MNEKPTTEPAGPAHRRLFAAAMMLGPVLLLASSVAFAAGDGLNKDELGGALLVYAFVALTLVTIGIARAVEPALPRASAALLAFAVLGCGAGVGFGIESIHAALPGGTSLEDADSAAGTLALFLPGAIFPLSFAALGVALWRARVSPRASGPRPRRGRPALPGRQHPRQRGDRDHRQRPVRRRAVAARDHLAAPALDHHRPRSAHRERLQRRISAPRRTVRVTPHLSRSTPRSKRPPRAGASRCWVVLEGESPDGGAGDDRGSSRAGARELAAGALARA
jgi:hypothetical protein